MTDRETGYALREEPEDDFCLCDEDTRCPACQARLTRHAIQAGTVPALVGYGTPRKPAAIASIGNGLYVRTGVQR